MAFLTGTGEATNDILVLYPEPLIAIAPSICSYLQSLPISHQSRSRRAKKQQNNSEECDSFIRAMQFESGQFSCIFPPQICCPAAAPGSPSAMGEQPWPHRSNIRNTENEAERRWKLSALSCLPGGFLKASLDPGKLHTFCRRLLQMFVPNQVSY